MIKICAISDLHGYLPKIEPCELVLICGDIVGLHAQRYPKSCKEWYIDWFKPWVNELPCDKVLFIPGNHEVGMEGHEEEYKRLFGPHDKATVLFHESYEYLGSDGKTYKIFGTPYCKIFGNWAYMRPNSDLKEKFSEIPEGLDILLTHDVVYGYADQSLQDIGWGTEEHFGTVELRNAILEKKPKLHLSGHIHTANHNLIMIGDTKHYNVSYLDEKYTPVFKPLYLDIDGRTD